MGYVVGGLGLRAVSIIVLFLVVSWLPPFIPYLFHTCAPFSIYPSGVVSFDGLAKDVRSFHSALTRPFSSPIQPTSSTSTSSSTSSTTTESGTAAASGNGSPHPHSHQQQLSTPRPPIDVHSSPPPVITYDVFGDPVDTPSSSGHGGGSSSQAAQERRLAALLLLPPSTPANQQQRQSASSSAGGRAAAGVPAASSSSVPRGGNATSREREFAAAFRTDPVPSVVGVGGGRLVSQAVSADAPINGSNTGTLPTASSPATVAAAAQSPVSPSPTVLPSHPPPASAASSPPALIVRLQRLLQGTNGVIPRDSRGVPDFDLGSASPFSLGGGAGGRSPTTAAAAGATAHPHNDDDDDDDDDDGGSEGSSTDDRGGGEFGYLGRRRGADDDEEGEEEEEEDDDDDVTTSSDGSEEEEAEDDVEDDDDGEEGEEDDDDGEEEEEEEDDEEDGGTDDDDEESSASNQGEVYDDDDGSDDDATSDGLGGDGEAEVTPAVGSGSSDQQQGGEGGHINRDLDHHAAFVSSFGRGGHTPLRWPTGSSDRGGAGAGRADAAESPSDRVDRTLGLVSSLIATARRDAIALLADAVIAHDESNDDGDDGEDGDRPIHF